MEVMFFPLNEKKFTLNVVRDPQGIFIRTKVSLPRPVASITLGNKVDETKWTLKITGVWLDTNEVATRELIVDLSPHPQAELDPQ